MPKVSVIMPSLNVSNYIDLCPTIVMQKYLANIEIICVDGASNDGTLDILNHYAASDSRIHIIHADKKSYGYQMNLGIRAATGEYIGIVETDDFVPRDMFEKLYHAAKEHHADVVKADFYRFMEKDGSYACRYNRLDDTDRYYSKVVSAAENLPIFRMIMNTWSVIYRLHFLV